MVRVRVEALVVKVLVLGAWLFLVVSVVVRRVDDCVVTVLVVMDGCVVVVVLVLVNGRVVVVLVVRGSCVKEEHDCVSVTCSVRITMDVIVEYETEALGVE